MRYFGSVIICFLFSSSAYALDFFADALYWKTTEIADWALSNNLNPVDQNVNYLTNSFDFKPGYRVGIGYEGLWDTKFYFTHYLTNTEESATGNLTSTFLGAKSVEKSHGDAFFSSGSFKQDIQLNIFDWDLGKHFNVDERLMVRPIIGVKGGWINQTITTHFNGFTATSETAKNNFKGIGPKAGIESVFTFYNKNAVQLNILANFASAYLCGNWTISDALQNSLNETYVVETPDRNMGALVLQGEVGASIRYKHVLMKLSYEISDWFDQYQVFDDGTGGHNNDLILQGGVFGVSYRF